MRLLVTQFAFVAERSVRRTLRQPAIIIPTIMFPLMLLALNAGGLSAVTRLPGFPADSYINFGLAVTFMQGGLFATTTAGTALAYDIETGFLDRLQLTPLTGTAILLGQMAGAVTLAVVGATVYLAVGLIAGVGIVAGVGGALVLIVMAGLVGLGFAALGTAIAAQTGSSEAVQGLFPLLFVIFFLTSVNLPRDLMEIDWFRTVATWNPLSYLIEAMRSLVITGWDGTALLRGFGAVAAIVVVATWLASRGMRTRMGRT